MIVMVTGVDISQLNSDEQEITLSGDTLSIENANYVDLSIYKDNSDATKFKNFC